MGRRCTVCSHSERQQIEQAMLGGVKYRDISDQYGVSTKSLSRHKAHVLAKLTKAHDVHEAADADSLLARLLEYEARAIDLLTKAEREGDYRAALIGIREARACVELLAELTHELDRKPTVNLLLSPEWIELRTLIVETLAPFPEACAALYERLGGALTDGHSSNGQHQDAQGADN